MNRFSKCSIKSKLTTIIMGTTGIALLSASFALVPHRRLAMREATAPHSEMLAGIVGANGAPALGSKDPESADRALKVPDTDPHVLAPRLLKKMEALLNNEGFS